MKANLLVIDESTAPGALSRFLTANGYVCHYARGPLKLREILKANRIDLILWQDGGHNADLVEDLGREFAAYPAIPLLHLYSHGAARSGLPKALKPDDALPSAAPGPQLLRVISDLMGGGQPAEANPAVAHTELAFRNLVSRLHNRLRRRSTAPASTSGRGSFSTIGTALNPTERELLLRGRRGLPVSPAWEKMASPILWLAGRLRR
jgi:hypothetical protein